MKNLQLEIEKLIHFKKAIIINDDLRINCKIFETIIDQFKVKYQDKKIKITYFSCEEYIKIGLSIETIWKRWLNLIESNQSKEITYLYLLDGLEFLDKKIGNFNFNENIYLYIIASSFSFFNNKSVFFQLTPKFYLNHKLNLSELLLEKKWNDFNHFLYHYCANFYEAYDYSKLLENWNYFVENIISQKIGFLNNKKISSQLLRQIIYHIAISNCGQFKIGEFCENYDARYESVILALNYLVKINFLFEAKFVLQNDIYSRKKSSLYFFRYPFIYFYFQIFHNSHNLIDNLLIAQLVLDYWSFNNFTNFIFSYKFESNSVNNILLKIDWFDLKIFLKNIPTEKISINKEYISKIYQIQQYEFSFKEISNKTFLNPIRLELKDKKSLNNIRIHQIWSYLYKI